MRKQVLVLGARYGTGNLGVDALLSGTLASLHANGPADEVVLLDFGRDPQTFEVPWGEGSAEIRFENLRFSWKFWLSNNAFRLLGVALLLRCLPIPGLRKWWISRNRPLATIARSSLALSLAGGDSFSDIYGLRRLLYVCLPQLLVLAVGCPLVLLPQTLGPFRSRWAKWMGRLIMRRARRVHARDQLSLRAAYEWLGDEADLISFSPDMAFALDPKPPAAGLPAWAMTGTDRPLIGLNVSGLLFMGGYNHSNMFGLSGDYPNLMRDTIRWFTLEAKADLVLVTHVTGWEGDDRACRQLFEELAPDCEGRLHLADPQYDHREIKFLIGRCTFFMGARMHACIAALSQGVPAVGLAYSRKFAGVFDSVGVPDLVVDLREPGCDVLRRVKEAFHARESHARRLAVSAAAARDSALALCGTLRSVCDEPIPQAAAAAPALPDLKST